MGNGEGGGGGIRVGYALPPKKVDTLITPSLVTCAQQRGIHLIPVDLHKPLIDQGPFHCLVHKIYSDDWNRQLLDFKSKNHSVLIIDSPDAIQRLHNRISMLDFVNQLPPSPFPISFGIPRQIVVDDSNAQLLNDPNNLLKFISFPAIAKPLVADGSAKSHEMSLVFNAQALIELRPPVVLQEFVDHGGVVFKVYVAGNHVKCVKRRSLPDASRQLQSQAQGGILTFSQISNLADDQGANCLEDAQVPPVDFVEFMAKNLRQALRLHLFNFDMIRDRRVAAELGIRYLVIDINYFPGYAKIPGYEAMLTDFLYDVVKNTRDNKDADLQHERQGQMGNAAE